MLNGWNIVDLDKFIVHLCNGVNDLFRTGYNPQPLTHRAEYEASAMDFIITGPLTRNP